MMPQTCHCGLVRIFLCSRHDLALLFAIGYPALKRSRPNVLRKGSVGTILSRLGAEWYIYIYIYILRLGACRSWTRCHLGTRRVRMTIVMYIYIYVCIYIYLYIYIYIRIYVYVCVYTYIYIYIWIICISTISMTSRWRSAVLLPHERLTADRPGEWERLHYYY